MAKTLAQITKQLNSADAGQIKSLENRYALIPQQIESDTRGLEAQQERSFGDILGGARQRGLGFSGIPLAEQARYTASEFLPAVARLKQQGQEQQMSLTEAIMGIRSGNSKMALQLQQQQKDRAEQRRQFNLNYQLAKKQGSGGGGGGGFTPSLTPPGSGQPKMKRKKDGGYAFTDPSGQPISAAAYALGTGTSFRSLLQKMANKGDKGAKTALGFVGDDFGFDAGKIGKNQGLYNALTWGLQ